jgi:hypothetical protein
MQRLLDRACWDTFAAMVGGAAAAMGAVRRFASA